MRSTGGTVTRVTAGVPTVYAEYEYSRLTGTNCDTEQTVSGTATQPPANSCGAGQTGGTVEYGGKTKYLCVNSTGEAVATEPDAPTPKSTGPAETTATKTRTTNPDSTITETETRTSETGEQVIIERTYSPDNQLLGEKVTGNDDSRNLERIADAIEEIKKKDEEISAGTGAAVGELYTGKGKTMQSVLSAFSQSVQAAPWYSISANWFSVSLPAAACPVWSVDVPYLGNHIDLGQFFCGSSAETIMNIVGSVLMVMAALTAFKWAML